MTYLLLHRWFKITRMEVVIWVCIKHDMNIYLPPTYITYTTLYLGTWCTACYSYIGDLANEKTHYCKFLIKKHPFRYNSIQKKLGFHEWMYVCKVESLVWRHRSHMAKNGTRHSTLELEFLVFWWDQKQLFFF